VQTIGDQQLFFMEGGTGSLSRVLGAVEGVQEILRDRKDGGHQEVQLAPELVKLIVDGCGCKS
jgi:hypothetical protein